MCSFNQAQLYALGCFSHLSIFSLCLKWRGGWDNMCFLIYLTLLSWDPSEILQCQIYSLCSLKNPQLGAATFYVQQGEPLTFMELNDISDSCHKNRKLFLYPASITGAQACYPSWKENSFKIVTGSADKEQIADRSWKKSGTEESQEVIRLSQPWEHFILRTDKMILFVGKKNKINSRK